MSFWRGVDFVLVPTGTEKHSVKPVRKVVKMNEGFFCSERAALQRDA